MGHHNFFDCSALDLFQKPREAFALVVDAGADVREDAVGGKLGLHRLDLPTKVVLLLGRGYTTVDSSKLGDRSRFCDKGVAESKVGDLIGEGLDVEASDIKTFVATDSGLEVNTPLPGPVSKRGQRDPQLFGC